VIECSLALHRKDGYDMKRSVLWFPLMVFLCPGYASSIRGHFEVYDQEAIR